MSNMYGLNNVKNSRDMSLETMTEGISVQGMREFSETIKANLLNGVTEKLYDTKGIEEALKIGWQGQSRAVFISQFQTGIQKIEKDLQTEYYDLMKRLGELMDNYFEQDNKMMDMIEEMK